MQRIANEVGPLMVGREAIGQPIVSLFFLSVFQLKVKKEGRRMSDASGEKKIVFLRR